MGHATRMAWRERVVWTLVVSMSVLQLTAGMGWNSARAAGQVAKPCWTSGLTPPVFERCGGCADAACPGTWINQRQVPVCEPADEGYFDCTPHDQLDAGFEGDCMESYSYLAMAICIIAGAGAGAIQAFPACAAKCAPAIPTGKGHLLCVAACVAPKAVVGGGVGWTACCSQGCFCISSCEQCTTQKKVVWLPGVLLRFPGCPGG